MFRLMYNEDENGVRYSDGPHCWATFENMQAAHLAMRAGGGFILREDGARWSEYLGCWEELAPAGRLPGDQGGD